MRLAWSLSNSANQPPTRPRPPAGLGSPHAAALRDAPGAACDASRTPAAAAAANSGACGGWHPPDARSAPGALGARAGAFACAPDACAPPRRPSQGGEFINQIKERTGARITLDKPFRDFDERVIHIESDDT